MSSTFFISEDVTWMPQSWVFYGLLRRLAPELASTYPDLAESMHLAESIAYSQVPDPLEMATLSQKHEALIEHFSPGINIGDIRLSDRSRFNAILEATERGVRRIIREGPSDFSEPTGYFGLVASISVFKALLRLDSRANENRIGPAYIALREGVSWTAPGWVYDLALEHFLAKIPLQVEHSPLLDVLLKHQEYDPRLGCDLSTLSDEQFALLAPIAQWLLTRYVELRITESASPNFHEELAPHLRVLTRTILAQIGESDASAR